MATVQVLVGLVLTNAAFASYMGALFMYFLKMFLKLIWFRVDIYSSALGFRFGV